MMDRSTIQSAWSAHSEADWPQFTSPHQGELMTLDTVISGCVVYFLDTPEGLDAQRAAILKDCLTDLTALVEDLDTDSVPYFTRLQELAALLLATTTQA